MSTDSPRAAAALDDDAVERSTDGEEPGPTNTSPPDGAPAHYRPQLDGLRALAVYLVVAFHAGISTFSGGFVGVDVFFVLSGYLVTRLLLRDIGTRSSVGFGRFYSRRFRRLLPAAFVALLVTAGVYVAVATPSDAANALGGFRSAFLYVANWHFIRQSSDYFATNVNTNPVVHFWSLAVEEQFYLLWPLLLTGLYLLTRRAGSRQWNVIRVVVTVGMLASLVSALQISRSDLSRAYYGTDTRAYELLAGALLAMTPYVLRVARKRRRLVRGLAPLNVAVIVLLATSVIHFGAISRGAAITVASCALILALEVSIDGVAVRMFSSPTAVYLGKISYGTYLWHWPVVVILTLRFHPSAWQLFAYTSLIGSALASLSYEILERPVRRSRALDRYRAPVIAAGLAVSIVSGLVFVPAILHHNRGATAVVATIGDANGGGGWRLPVPPTNSLRGTTASSYGGVSCLGKPIGDCVVVHGSRQRVLLMGDSHALTLIPAFAAIARRRDMTLAVTFFFNCAWQQGLAPFPLGEPASGPSNCRQHQNDWYQRVVPQYRPDIVVLASRGLEDPASHENYQAPDGHMVRWGDPAFDSTIRDAAARSLGSLRQAGRKIVIIEPLPFTPPRATDPKTCLSGAKYLEDCRYVATAEPTPVVTYYRSVADGRAVWSIDLDKVICPYFPICDPVVGGTVVKSDRQHITSEYSKQIADPISRALESNGVFG